MEKYKGHNSWLNQGKNETNEEYNERIGNWERKEQNKQVNKIAAYEEFILILKAEKKHQEERKKNIPDRNEDRDYGYELALDYIIHRAESMKELHEDVLNNPTEYEIKWEGGDTYKLTKRK